MIATEVTDTHASMMMAETSGSFGASGGILRADANVKAQASDTRTTHVLRKAIVQSTFRDLYDRVRENLVIVAPSVNDLAPQLAVDDDLKPDGSRTWILDPSNIRRGELIELTVELEAEPLFQARTVVSTFLDIFEQDQVQFGIANVAELTDAAVLSRVIEKLGAGLVPLRAKARDYVVVTKADGTDLIAHRGVVGSLGRTVETAPLYLVGVATETLFWKDIRSVVFARSEFQILARVLRPDLQSSWSPLKLVDVLARVAPHLHDAMETLNSTVLESMDQGPASNDGSSQARLVLSEYADLVAEALGVELDADDPMLLALLEPPEGLKRGLSVKNWRLAMAPVANHVAELAGKSVDPQVAAKLRVLAQMKHGLSPIERREVPRSNSTPGKTASNGRLLDTEIIAIY
ncbi:MAG TPA: hypothetical protein VNV87_06635, partial [Acidimicrobiales bacterium]|nr:hypothetical protein [Acidimicrobiales bacterium]